MPSLVWVEESLEDLSRDGHRRWQPTQNEIAPPPRLGPLARTHNASDLAVAD